MKPLFQKAKFHISVPKLSQCPDDSGYEIAFAGRSNAGKSSCINTLTRQKSLARTSKTPGRTQHIVFFNIDDEHRLVDLPGYGFAKVSDKMKKQWQAELSAYLNERQSLRALVLIIDVRRGLTDYDRNLLDWASESDLPIHIVLTKSDKLKRGPAKSTLLGIRKEIKDAQWQATAQLFSSLKRDGVDELERTLMPFMGWVSQEVGTDSQ